MGIVVALVLSVVAVELLYIIGKLLMLDLVFYAIFHLIIAIKIFIIRE